MQVEIGIYEVTFAEYDRFATATNREKPSDAGWGRRNRPVINISWYDATAYAKWLSQKTGKKYRLPTEEEWEYAARAGTQTDYWWGNEIGNNRAVCDGCGSRWDIDKMSTAPVGYFPANPFGLYDTVGNVWEWTCSAYDDQYRCADESNVDDYRVLLGGSWYNTKTGVKVTYRHKFKANEGSNEIGFRLLKEN
jgi:formylglycine-generating enzyme required for sulfatase activity